MFLVRDAERNTVVFLHEDPRKAGSTAVGANVVFP
jgi:hypothetical protein